MGIQKQVAFEGGLIPEWAEVRDVLAGKGFPIRPQMIDGELSLPDELPSKTWRELRVGTPHGMVTLRREAGGILFVIWGNADPLLQQARDALVWAFASCGNGRVDAANGACSAVEFARQVDLSLVLKETAQ